MTARGDRDGCTLVYFSRRLNLRATSLADLSSRTISPISHANFASVIFFSFFFHRAFSKSLPAVAPRFRKCRDADPAAVFICFSILATCTQEQLYCRRDGRLIIHVPANRLSSASPPDDLSLRKPSPRRKFFNRRVRRDSGAYKNARATFSAARLSSPARTFIHEAR